LSFFNFNFIFSSPGSLYVKALANILNLFYNCSEVLIMSQKMVKIVSIFLVLIMVGAMAASIIAYFM